MDSKNNTVIVGLSGGVDSALAAWTLKQQGFNVIGVTMATWDGSLDIPKIEGKSGCYGPNEDESIAEAKTVADRLGIPHYTVQVSSEYTHEVLDYFRSEYRAGRTPNPCVRCNQTIKFGALLNAARKMGIQFDYFATGHYARLDFKSPTEPFLYRATDLSKDQSYFLSRLSIDQLSIVKFPLGGMRKEDVKALAREIGWADYADKKESQDFLECGDYSVLFDESDNVPGDFVDLEGNVLGRHKGIVHYTIGQRKGLNIGGQPEPLFVVKIDAEKNQVVLGPRNTLQCTEVHAVNVNLMVENNAPCLSKKLSAQIRLGHKGSMASIVNLNDNEITVRFDEPQFASTPGQILVLYDGDGVVLSAVINK